MPSFLFRRPRPRTTARLLRPLALGACVLTALLLARSLSGDDAMLTEGLLLMLGVLIVITLLTWRLWRDEALHAENEAQLRMMQTMVDNMPAGVTLFDNQQNLLYYNKSFQRLLDFPDSLFNGDTPPHLADLIRYNAVRGEYGDGDPEAIVAAAVTKAQEAQSHAFIRERPNGQLLEVRGEPLPEGGFVSTHTDVTRERRTAASLRLAEKVIAASPTGIMVTDAQGTIVTVNPAFTEITGYPQAEAVGKTPRILNSGRHDAAFYRAFWRALTANGQWEGEIWDRRKNGSVYPKWLSISSLYDAETQALTHYVATFTDITERKQAEERIHHLAHHDALTGLANRLTLEARLEQALADARRHGTQIAVFFIDLDRFKMINDSLGHQVGDQVLLEVARRLNERLRATDVVARLGGDEFVVVLPDLAESSYAANVAKDLIRTLEQPIPNEAGILHISGSIGIAVFPSDGDSVEALMKSADTAMYQAKGNGRNNYQFFTRAMTDAANERLAMENRLRLAWTQDEFEIYYQPQVEAENGRIAGVEALLRWRHPQEGMIPPDRFIPIAEESGMIVGLGEWVLRQSCLQLAAWRDEGIGIRMSVNLSTKQFRSKNLVDTINSALAVADLPGHALELEITESALMQDPDAGVELLNKIKEMGVALALDDFGTGYSSLAYLKLFPLDRLKIDRSFVRDIETDANDRTIALSTIALAHSLGLEVTAEGVETESQLALLRTRGCEEAQGYLFSKPLPADEVFAKLQRGALP